MNVKPLNSYDTLLLIDDSTGAIFPFSALGFEGASGSLRGVRKRARDAIFLNRSGEIFRISNITKKKFGLLDFIYQILGSPYEIEVARELVDMDIDEIKEKLRVGIDYYRRNCLIEDETWQFVRLTEGDVESRLSDCKSAEEIFSKLELPKPEDCLDQI